MKKTVITFIFCLCALLTVQAKEKYSKLVIIFNDETTAEFNLADKPKVEFHQDMTYVTYQTYKFEFNTQDMNTFEFIAPNDTKYAGRKCVLDVDQTKETLLLRPIADGNGDNISLSSLGTGEFEFKISNGYSFKLIKK